jgi:hypothetical protein
MIWWGRASCPSFNDRQDENDSKPEIRLGNDAGLVRRGSRTVRNEGAASGARTPIISAEVILRQLQMRARPNRRSRCSELESVKNSGTLQCQQPFLFIPQHATITTIRLMIRNWLKSMDSVLGADRRRPQRGNLVDNSKRRGDDSSQDQARRLLL